jgi:hypothetical protein
MSDIPCAKCREPWDAYGVRHGDMEPDEAKRFLKGEGCPCCGFGARCPSCDGSGRTDQYSGANCPTCKDKGYILAWSPERDARGFVGGLFYTGYSPNVRALGKVNYRDRKTLGTRTFPERISAFESADGTVLEFWLICPDCKAEGNFEPCSSCDGKGTLTPDPDAEEAAVRAELDWSDEDPMEILERRGVL